ncbi:rod shape-determining protein MreD [Paenibacillus alkalitolerans]|uniref:rod shape-determining protein MreD n=1 Tax=Paenibacillus alkalitolerans TaxID=2799335 RepID=UPI0018F42B86|nr:rod shape-determining protein MreD [Paenibacillus alkalitolerans]
MVRRWILVVLALLLFFLLESSFFPWIIPPEWRSEMLLFPRLVLVGVIYIGILVNRHAGAMVGVAFGLLQDVVFFGHMLGANAFTFALAGYAAGLLLKNNAVNLFSVFIVQLASLLLFESSLYALYRLFNITNLEFGWAFLQGMLPSLLVDLLLALILYFPARKWLEAPLSAREPEEN